MRYVLASVKKHSTGIKNTDRESAEGGGRGARWVPPPCPQACRSSCGRVPPRCRARPAAAACAEALERGRGAETGNGPPQRVHPQKSTPRASGKGATRAIASRVRRLSLRSSPSVGQLRGAQWTGGHFLRPLRAALSDGTGTRHQEVTILPAPSSAAYCDERPSAATYHLGEACPESEELLVAYLVLNSGQSTFTAGAVRASLQRGLRDEIYVRALDSRSERSTRPSCSPCGTDLVLTSPTPRTNADAMTQTVASKTARVTPQSSRAPHLCGTLREARTNEIRHLVRPSSAGRLGSRHAGLLPMTQNERQKYACALDSPLGAVHVPCCVQVDTALGPGRSWHPAVVHKARHCNVTCQCLLARLASGPFCSAVLLFVKKCLRTGRYAPVCEWRHYALTG